MVGLDTDVLIRILIDDGSPNVAVARRFAVEQVERGERLHVDRIVLAEADWVLRAVYGYARDPVRVALGAVLDNGAYEIEDRATVVAARKKIRRRQGRFLRLPERGTARRSGMRVHGDVRQGHARAADDTRAALTRRRRHADADMPTKRRRRRDADDAVCRDRTAPVASL